MPGKLGLTKSLTRPIIWSIPVGLYSLLSLLKSRPLLALVPDIPSALDAALSLALAIVLAFRVNRAYERWWEARTLWGTLVNVSRNLAIKVRELERCSDDHETIRDLIVAFCVGLKNHLHGVSDLTSLPGFDSDANRPRHVPAYVAGKIYSHFSRWRSDDLVTDGQLWLLDAEARMFLEVCGGCERIKTTMVSISWRAFTVQCIVAYLLLLPWGLVDDFGVWTIPLTMLVAYFVITAETISQSVERPFGDDDDQLDLDAVCDAIDRSVAEIFQADTSTSR